MTSVMRISHDDGAKYVTLRIDESAVQNIQEFLSSIGISRDKRKNLYKNYHIHSKGGSSDSYTDTLQVVHSADRTTQVEIFTGKDVIILGIRASEAKEVQIGEALLKHFKGPHNH